MSVSLKNLARFGIVAGSLAFLIGCATSADQDRMMMSVQDAQATADEALTAANEARSLALEADATARAAQFQATQNAQRIDELDEKIDRMFERSMAK